MIQQAENVHLGSQHRHHAVRDEVVSLYFLGHPREQGKNLDDGDGVVPVTLVVVDVHLALRLQPRAQLLVLELVDVDGLFVGEVPASWARGRDDLLAPHRL